LTIADRTGSFDNAGIKAAVMSYGGVMTTMLWNNAGWISSSSKMSLCVGKVPSERGVVCGPNAGAIVNIVAAVDCVYAGDDFRRETKPTLQGGFP
jgi:hypothetical protein